MTTLELEKKFDEIRINWVKENYKLNFDVITDHDILEFYSLILVKEKLKVDKS